ncbi:glycosyltransferase family 4 protein [Fluviibacterium sp. DFM31]|uniref:Glycosyltransferase family 4 protein n=1 Tax=Meridianimarinicoccus marinus TaxID=3231483 RepID=A0ABV3L9J4_9RHOB
MVKLFGTAGSEDPLLGLTQDQLEKHFNAEEYLADNADVQDSGIDPFQHYLKFGWKEGRRPFRKFDVGHYTVQHLDGAAVCPLAHYVATGLPRNLSINDEQKRFSDWVHSQDTAWQNEVSTLLASLGHDAARLRDHGLGQHLKAMFSAASYRRAKGLTRSVSDNECFIRYVVFDFLQGMSPGPLFDEACYLQKATVAGLPPLTEGTTAFEHWIAHGRAARIVPNALFEAEDYLALNKDLEAYPGPLFEHFILHGQHEKRQFMRDVVISPDADTSTRISLREFLDHAGSSAAAQEELQVNRRFLRSGKFADLVDKATALEPDVGGQIDRPAYLPPWHDAAYQAFKRLLAQLPEGQFKSVVLIPFCKVGGADYVAGILSRALGEIRGPVLVLQTDQPDWARPDWFDGVAHADLSQTLTHAPEQLRSQMLYEILRKIRPDHIFNVNSRLAFETCIRYGKRLNRFSRLHAYYFCADRTKGGVEAGYPVWYFARAFPHLETTITDSRDLADTLAERFGVPPGMTQRLMTLYTPAVTPVSAVSVAEAQIRSARRRKRPCLMWAGRFDRQKRFDLLLEVAERLPRVDFKCWGKAVLDPPPDLSKLPENVQIHDPFKSYDELPLEDVDGFFYTSDWDGIPTILIELGAMGMPIVASASGGVPELIGDARGWLVPVGSDPEDYAAAIKALLADPKERVRRATALQTYVGETHSEAAYLSALGARLNEGEHD